MINDREELIKVYVSRIEMTGFKSFVERTVVDLEPGIAAIVGPNGCGKTNICDAIRWVLGEENVRLLRGSRIEDIIFAGTELRKPTGMAEVSLTLSDVQDVLPLDYSEVTVTRRVFRSGESQFYINKVPSRLKDIVSLFLGTGLGRRAYSVMERDMIDWILDDDSGQRRRIVEEAAGVSKYKMRRKETMNKLELTQRDLERVEDLISEVERRVRQLARQAAKARRYDRLVSRIREVETYSSVKEYDDMTSRRRQTDKELESLETQLAAAARDVSVAEAEIERMKLEILTIDKEINSHGKEMAEVTDRVQKAENDRIVLSERSRSIDEKLKEISALQSDRQNLLAARRDALRDKQNELKTGSERLDALTAMNRDVGKAYRDAEGELRARREQSVVSAKETIETMKRHIDVASAVTELRSKRMHQDESLRVSQAKRSDLSARSAAAQQEVDALKAHLGELNTICAGHQGEISELDRVVDELTGKIERIREKRSRLGEQAAKAASRHDVFRELVERYEGYESGVRALMQGSRDRQGVHGVVGDIVRCTETRYEPAVVAALSDAIQYVVVEGRERAVDSVRMLKEEKKGSATLVLLDCIPRAGGDGLRDTTHDRVIGRITNFIDCEPAFRELFDYLLHDVFVVETLEDAFDLSNREGDHRRSYVTPDGDAVFRGSIVRSGGNGKSSDAVLGRREKVADLAGEVEALTKLVREQDKAFEELTASLGDLISRRDSKQEDRAQAMSAIAEQERLLHAKISESDSLRNSLAEVEAEIARLRTSLEEIDKQSAEMGHGQDILDVGQGGLFEALGDDGELEAGVDDLRRQFETTNREILKLQSTAGFLTQTIERITGEIETVEAELRDLSDTDRRLVAKQEDLSIGEASLKEDIHRLLTILGEFEAKRKSALEKKQEVESRIEDARLHIKERQREKEAYLSRRQELQTESNLLQVKSDALRQRMLEEYDVDIIEVELKDIDRCENCQEELAKLRGHLRNLGPVNLVALDEYDVEKERYDFLKTQRDDLTKARESLDEAILRINRRARSEFTEIFEKVRKDFRKNFRTLFEGGDADLRLRYEGDSLESPIDILAQPSGKKLEQISLLSGGERALTAIAFLFAVYHTRPSPFCLLDEVDAPLDDANVSRFVNLIRHFAERTQFLMVTHNKRTMEAASCLYGVTMEEPGISRMVSVKLERAAGEVLEPVG